MLLGEIQVGLLVQSGHSTAVCSKTERRELILEDAAFTSVRDPQHCSMPVEYEESKVAKLHCRYRFAESRFLALENAFSILDNSFNPSSFQYLKPRVARLFTAALSNCQNAA
jgi:hypothetical protein